MCYISRASSDCLLQFFPVVLAVVSMLGVAPSPSVAQGRHALIVGVDDYEKTELFPILKNAKRDAELLSRKLTTLGFQSKIFLNPRRVDLEKGLLEFNKHLRSAPSGALAVFFFAGHGAQVKRENVLYAKDAQRRSDGIAFHEIYDTLDIDNKRIAKVFILDACRNEVINPGERGSESGFAAQLAPQGSIIAYSTSPNRAAKDIIGGAQNSPYSKALGDLLDRPGLKLEEIFKLARQRVFLETKGEQTPWESTSLIGDIYLVKGSEAQDGVYAGLKIAPGILEPLQDSVRSGMEEVLVPYQIEQKYPDLSGLLKVSKIGKELKRKIVSRLKNDDLSDAEISKIEGALRGN